MEAKPSVNDDDLCNRACVQNDLPQGLSGLVRDTMDNTQELPSHIASLQPFFVSVPFSLPTMGPTQKTAARRLPSHNDPMK